ncbi:hypothetical protein L596_011592 [Steinernema carpocapsae]|uniref:Uncharacterized protein n=1 Tax=Steinernema carpocapsae TaxID=34508 RepID=A0A4U5NUE2_STECR|nr:hypothetical protein L596_011592 [Steinernema carpocapsae]
MTLQLNCGLNHTLEWHCDHFGSVASRFSSSLHSRSMSAMKKFVVALLIAACAFNVLVSAEIENLSEEDKALLEAMDGIIKPIELKSSFPMHMIFEVLDEEKVAKMLTNMMINVANAQFKLLATKYMNASEPKLAAKKPMDP